MKIKKNEDLRLWRANASIKQFIEKPSKSVGIYITQDKLDELVEKYPDCYLKELEFMHNLLQHQVFFRDNRKENGCIEVKCYGIVEVGGIIEATFFLTPHHDRFYIEKYEHSGAQVLAGTAPWQDFKASYRKDRFERDKKVRGSYWKR